MIKFNLFKSVVIMQQKTYFIDFIGKSKHLILYKWFILEFSTQINNFLLILPIYFNRDYQNL